MSDQVFGVWKDEMRQPNAGSQGTLAKPIIDVFASVRVPDGLWAVSAKIDADNRSSNHQLVHFVLRAGNSEDHRVVRLAPNGQADLASVSLMVLASFSGPQTNRINEILLGLWDTGYPPDIKAGRMKIIAMRVNHWVMEPSPGTSGL